jgi:hypothetical protein
MQLSLKPYDKNIYPLGGILIKGVSIVHWIKEIQAVGLSLSAVSTYPIPDLIPNSIWGCLVVATLEQKKIDIRGNMYYQVIDNLLFIPEKAILFPKLFPEEIQKLFLNKPHLFHPELGIVELLEEINWQKYITTLKQSSVEATKPEPPAFIPKQIKSFQIKPISVEETIKKMEDKEFPQQEKLKDEPLTPLEKAKLYFYRQLFQKTKTSYTKDNKGEKIEKTDLLHTIENVKDFFSTHKDTHWSEEMQKEYEDLERRNQSQIEQLLEMLKKNPQEALKYAIPLDSGGTTRGGESSSPFELFKRWSNFSLFDTPSNQSGTGTTNLGDKVFYDLQTQYHRTAEGLIQQKDYRKAAFVYMKLLKNYLLAAQTLEKGELYQEAASVYLKYLTNKEKAAECYEKGKSIEEAIAIYKELEKYEKVGDLYMQINQKRNAEVSYEIVVGKYTDKKQFVKASLILRNKMQDGARAQEFLLLGWRQKEDAFNCMNNYFANIKEIKELKQEIQNIYDFEVDSSNESIFLQVLKHEIEKDEALIPTVRKIAYEIISKQLPANPSMVSELIPFNKKDKRVVKDTIRYKSTANTTWRLL